MSSSTKNELKRYTLVSSYIDNVGGVQMRMELDPNGSYARAEDCNQAGVEGKRFSFYLGLGDFEDRKVGFVECSDVPDEVSWIEVNHVFIGAEN